MICTQRARKAVATELPALFQINETARAKVFLLFYVFFYTSVILLCISYSVWGMSL